MDPDIGMTECGDCECGCRVESNGDSPIQKEAAEVHAVARESENAFLYQGHVTVSWIEMVGASGSCHSQV